MFSPNLCRLVSMTQNYKTPTVQHQRHCTSASSPIMTLVISGKIPNCHCLCGLFQVSLLYIPSTLNTDLIIWQLQWLSPPGTFHILIGKFSYFVIRFLLNSSMVKSDNEIGKVNDKKNSDLKI